MFWHSQGAAQYYKSSVESSHQHHWWRCLHPPLSIHSYSLQFCISCVQRIVRRLHPISRTLIAWGSFKSNMTEVVSTLFLIIRSAKARCWTFTAMLAFAVLLPISIIRDGILWLLIHWLKHFSPFFHPRMQVSSYVHVPLVGGEEWLCQLSTISSQSHYYTYSPAMHVDCWHYLTRSSPPSSLGPQEDGQSGSSLPCRVRQWCGFNFGQHVS